MRKGRNERNEAATRNDRVGVHVWPESHHERRATRKRADATKDGRNTRRYT